MFRQIIICAFIIIFCCGFFCRKKEVPFILFSSEPITTGAELVAKTDFRLGERIYYMIFAPKGFNDDVLRIQIIKKNDKGGFEGYTVKYAQDIVVDIGSKVYSGSLQLYDSGMYIAQVVEFSNSTKPIAYAVFGVKDD